jgi:cellulose biosynthesis protein BcsQ
MITDLLYTWIDVQAALQASVSAWPDALFSARAYWDSVVIEHEADQGEAVSGWLAEFFGPRWVGQAATRRIRLESQPEAPERSLAVSFEAAEKPAPVGVALRTFHQPDTAMRRTPARPPSDQLSPPIFAWHSFKGGVGRTTTALQFAQLLSKRGAKVMLVDMDFEAPGITWMTAESRLPTPPIAMSDVLALIHSTPPDKIPETIGLIAHRLRDSVVDGFVILPAMRGSQREPDIRPEHLESPSIEPLADILSRIGAAVGVSHVIADLRAGRSELAASLLLDRRVARVLVTTPAGQSVKGIAQMLQDMSESLPAATTDPGITVIVSKLVAPGSMAFDSVKATLTRSAEALLEEHVDAPFPVRFTAALHDENLLSLPLDWVDATSRLDAATVLDVSDLPVDLTFARWAAEAMPVVGTPQTPVAATDPAPDRTPPADIDDLRRRLAAFAKPLVLAEASTGKAFLDAQFLTRLVQAHRSRLPLVVVVGTKGSGKTFTFLRMVGHETWKGFAEASAGYADFDGRVLPVAWPKNLPPTALHLIDRALGAADRANAVAIELGSALDEARTTMRTVSDWRNWWIAHLARRAGFDTLEEMSRATARTTPPLFVIDGLEDLLPSVHSDLVEQSCLRALLQEVPAWLKASGSLAGLIVFTRSDYVRAAIPQNTEHFRAIHKPFDLWWDRSEALRLVDWIAREAKVIDPNLTRADALLRIWGRKVGEDASRESVTDVWVMDALCTRSAEVQEVQARDLVRLVAKAAELSIGQGWQDRLLAPQAIRDALPSVGRSKIVDIAEEFPPLGRALERMRALTALRVPFTRADLMTDEDRLALAELENAGIAWRDRDEIWLVSLYRRGLGMQLQPRRRERVLR